MTVANVSEAIALVEKAQIAIRGIFTSMKIQSPSSFRFSTFIEWRDSAEEAMNELWELYPFIHEAPDENTVFSLRETEDDLDTLISCLEDPNPCDDTPFDSTLYIFKLIRIMYPEGLLHKVGKLLSYLKGWEEEGEEKPLSSQNTSTKLEGTDTFYSEIAIPGVVDNANVYVHLDRNITDSIPESDIKKMVDRNMMSLAIGVKEDLKEYKAKGFCAPSAIPYIRDVVGTPTEDPHISPI